MEDISFEEYLLDQGFKKKEKSKTLSTMGDVQHTYINGDNSIVIGLEGNPARPAIVYPQIYEYLTPSKRRVRTSEERCIPTPRTKDKWKEWIKTELRIV